MGNKQGSAGSPRNTDFGACLWYDINNRLEYACCNCNVNVCYALRTSQLFNTPNMSRSAYVAHVDPKNCVACGRCVEYCPAGAVKLGQKLCGADGTCQTYPKHALPGDHFWSEKDWDWDYRDNNRKNCYDTGTAPCKTTCPAHIAVEGYLKLASQGRYRDALALIKKNNPLRRGGRQGRDHFPAARAGL